MNSFTEFVCLERSTFYNFVSVTKGRLTNRLFHAKRLLDSRGGGCFKKNQ